VSRKKLTFWLKFEAKAKEGVIITMPELHGQYNIRVGKIRRSKLSTDS
jgi:hypothetical protein